MNDTALMLTQFQIPEYIIASYKYGSFEKVNMKDIQCSHGNIRG